MESRWKVSGGGCVQKNSEKQRETAKKQRAIPLFFVRGADYKSRISAGNAMSIAVIFLENSENSKRLLRGRD